VETGETGAKEAANPRKRSVLCQRVEFLEPSLTRVFCSRYIKQPNFSNHMNTMNDFDAFLWSAEAACGPAGRISSERQRSSRPRRKRRLQRRPFLHIKPWRPWRSRRWTFRRETTGRLSLLSEIDGVGSLGAARRRHGMGTWTARRRTYER